MVKATEYFGGNFLKAEDIQGPKTLTIRKVEPREMEDNKTKLVVSFNEFEKELVLNKINTNRIIEWAGSDETDNWTGKQITLVRSSVEYDGKDVPCIRVKKKDSPEANAASANDHRIIETVNDVFGRVEEDHA